MHYIRALLLTDSFPLTTTTLIPLSPSRHLHPHPNKQTNTLTHTHAYTSTDPFLDLHRIPTPLPHIGITRLRTGKAGCVTPLDFRYTLSKFGIILPKEMSDKVFANFDKDRSGSMNFDDFAYW